MNSIILNNKSSSIITTQMQYDICRSIFSAAETGDLTKILSVCEKNIIDNIDQIIKRICAIAINNNHINILQHFFSKEAFTGCPDLMFEYFINAVKINAHVDVIKFFVENGIDIGQNSYKIIKIAKKWNRKNILTYFSVIDPSVII